MSGPAKYFIVDAKAMPEIFRKVAEAKRLLETGEEKTVNGAAQAVNISRSAFYKYKDSVYFYEDKDKRRVVTYSLWLSDDPGVLSKVLAKLSSYHVNVLTVNQNIPVDRVAVVTITFRTNGDAELELEAMHQGLLEIPGVVKAKRI